MTDAMPSLTSGIPKTALSTAARTSQAASISMPAPNVKPLIRAIVGDLVSVIAGHCGWPTYSLLVAHAHRMVALGEGATFPSHCGCLVGALVYTTLAPNRFEDFWRERAASARVSGLQHSYRLISAATFPPTKCLSTLRCAFFASPVTS
jgi:hypothetical protein